MFYYYACAAPRPPQPPAPATLPPALRIHIMSTCSLACSHHPCNKPLMRTRQHAPHVPNTNVMADQRHGGDPCTCEQYYQKSLVIRRSADGGHDVHSYCTGICLPGLPVHVGVRRETKHGKRASQVEGLHRRPPTHCSRRPARHLCAAGAFSSAGPNAPPTSPKPHALAQRSRPSCLLRERAHLNPLSPAAHSPHDPLPAPTRRSPTAQPPPACSV